MADQDIGRIGASGAAPCRRAIFSGLGLIGLSAAAGVGMIPGEAARADPTKTNLDLTQYRGRVLYLDFWASWCGPCKLSFPYMQRMAMNYPKSKFAVLAVNVDHSRQSAEAFLNQVGAEIPIAFDPSGALAAKYKIAAMPSSILFDRQGKVRFVHQGFFEDKIDLYEAHIQELLNEQ